MFSSRDLGEKSVVMSEMEQQTEPTEEEKKASEVLQLTNPQIEPYANSNRNGSYVLDFQHFRILELNILSTVLSVDDLFQEERLREEAAKRLERRRKKMLSPEERLAR